MRILNYVKVLIWIGALVLVLAVIGVTLLFTVDLNRAKPWINSRISGAIGRPVLIHGNISLDWASAPNTESGWRKKIPWAHLIAREITVANAGTENKTPDFAQLKELNFLLNPLALLSKNISLSDLRLDSPSVVLQRTIDGRTNWEFDHSSSPGKWHFVVNQLHLNGGTLKFSDAIRHTDMVVSIDNLNANQNDVNGVNWKLHGSLNGAAASGNGTAGNVLSLSPTSTYPIETFIQVGKTAISLAGTVSNPDKVTTLDMRLKMSGVSMAQLYSLTGIVLPETPPYVTEGHLIGKLNAQGGNFTYENFSGKVGASDLNGRIEYQSKQPRPFLQGNVVSNLLQLRDLAPLIGADSNASKRDRGADVLQPANKILPIEPFKSDRWSSIDADIKFTGKKIIRDKALPIDNLTTHLQLHDGVLSLLPLNFGVAGGNLNADIKLDGRHTPIQSDMKISARHLKLKELFPAVKAMQASFGELDADMSLSASGNSIATLLGASNGEIKARIESGTISKLLVEEIGLNIGNVVLTKVTGDEQIKLNCMASDFGVTDGLMKVRTAVVDTESSVLNVTGNINLKQEKLNLTINPQARDVRIISLRAPVYITGNFSNPSVKIDKGVVALKAGASAALAAATTGLSAVVPLINPGKQEQSQCGKLLMQTKKKPVAPIYVKE